MRYTVLLVPNDEWTSVSVPAMPGCVSHGRTREEALRNIVESMAGWLVTEAEQGRRALAETPEVVAAGVSEALQIIEEMRRAGEIPPDNGNQMELTSVDTQQPAIA